MGVLLRRALFPVYLTFQLCTISASLDLGTEVVELNVELHSGFSSSPIPVTLYDYFEDIRFSIPILIPYQPMPKIDCDQRKYKLCHYIHKMHLIVEEIDVYQRQQEKFFMIEKNEGKTSKSRVEKRIKLQWCRSSSCEMGFQQFQDDTKAINNQISSETPPSPQEAIAVMTSLQALIDHLEFQSRFRNTILNFTLTMNSCLQQRIPLKAVKPAVFKSYLTTINSNLEDEGMRLAIPPDQLKTYYELPLARCDFWNGDDGRADGVVVIQLPVVRRNSQYSLRAISPIKFGTREAGICEIVSTHKEIIFDENTHEVLFLEQNYLDECVGTRLCQLSRATNKSKVPNESKCIAERLGAFPAGLQFNGGVSIWSPPESTLCSIKCTYKEPNYVFYNSVTSEVYLTNVAKDIFIRARDGRVMNLKGTAPIGTTRIALPCKWTVFVGDLAFEGFPATCRDRTFSVKGLLPEVMFLESST